MGTNYYARVAHQSAVCSECGQTTTSKLLHIGKSSSGWCFAVHVIPEKGLESLEDWKTFLQGKVIEDEYGDVLTLEELLRKITTRSARRINEERGVDLVRHEIDGLHCVGHGEGPWDYITGDFS